MKSIFKALVILALAIGATGCLGVMGGDGQLILGSGDVIEETRAVSNISGVELALPGTLHITTGKSESLRISAQENLMEYIETNDGAGRLVIASRPGFNLQYTRPIDYYLTVKQLDSIEISSSGSIETGELQADSFSITINSSGDLKMAGLDCKSLDIKVSSSGNTILSNLAADTISVKISSSGNVEIKKGQVQKEQINISSSGQFRAPDVESISANVILTSSGDATVRISDRLTGSVSSSGNIKYFGSPEVNVSTNSSGRTIHAGN